MVSDRDLDRAPVVSHADPDLVAAVALAEAHARGWLRLPPVDLVWVSRPDGWPGQMFGREIRLNLAANLSPREVAEVALHEFKHAADHHAGQLAGMSSTEQEDRANSFAAAVLRHPDFHSLSCRRPSRSARRETMDYEEFIKMGGVSGNLTGARAAALLAQHRAVQVATRRAAPLAAGEVRCGTCHGIGFRVALGRFRCRGCGAVLDLQGRALA